MARVKRHRVTLRPAEDLSGILERGLVLAQAHGPRFDNATPDEVVGALFAGWTLCGKRASVGTGGPDRHVYVWRRGARWVGFTLFAEATVPTGTDADPVRVHDYVTLIDPGPGEDPWESLPGRERIRCVLGGPRGPARARRVVSAVGAVEFLDALIGACELGRRTRARGGHLVDMVSIMLGEDMPDPDGEVAAARMMAALGGFGLPSHVLPG